MPIKKREVTPTTIRWTHQIVCKQFTAKFRVFSGRVSGAEPAIHWAMGQRFDKVRETCSQRGWELEEVANKRSA